VGLKELFAVLVLRNSGMAYFGGVAFAAAAVFAMMIPLHRIQVQGVNAWVKPLRSRTLHYFFFRRPGDGVAHGSHHWR
jgi:hypothetical protein